MKKQPKKLTREEKQLNKAQFFLRCLKDGKNTTDISRRVCVEKKTLYKIFANHKLSEKPPAKIASDALSYKIHILNKLHYTPKQIGRLIGLTPETIRTRLENTNPSFVEIYLELQMKTAPHTEDNKRKQNYSFLARFRVDGEIDIIHQTGKTYQTSFEELVGKIRVVDVYPIYSRLVRSAEYNPFVSHGRPSDFDIGFLFEELKEEIGGIEESGDKLTTLQDTPNEETK